MSLNFTSFSGGSVVKNLPASAGDAGSIPGPGRSPGEGNGNPLQYSCLENSMDGGTWQATTHGVARVRHDLATKPSPPQCWRGHYLVKAVPSAGGNSVFQK